MGMRNLLLLPQVSPAEWGARQDYDSWSPAGPKDGVTVHFTGTKDTQKNALRDGHAKCDDKIRGIENYHMDARKWRGIGYNMAVCPHGDLYRLRGRARAAHNPGDSDGDGATDNVDSVGVLMLVGPDESPSPASLEMLRRVCSAVGGYVVPHSKTRSTSCPGDALRSWIAHYGKSHENDTPAQPEKEQPVAEDEAYLKKWPEHFHSIARRMKAKGLITKHTDPSRLLSEMTYGEFLIFIFRDED